MSDTNAIAGETKDYIKKLCEVFLSVPVPHGQIFDDNRRWCTTCQKPVVIPEVTPQEHWNDKVCPTCMSIWPEYFKTFEDQITDQFQF